MVSKYLSPDCEFDLNSKWCNEETNYPNQKSVIWNETLKSYLSQKIDVLSEQKKFYLKEKIATQAGRAPPLAST